MYTKTKLDKLPKSSKLYIGIDQSLTCTSICIMQNQEIDFIQIKPRYMGVPRLHEIYDTVCKLLDDRRGCIAGIAIEGYAYSATGAVFNLGELGGVIRLACSQRNINLIEVPPTFLKKVITGKGNSKKDVLIKEVYKNYNFDTNDNNDCDAFCLALVALKYYEEEIHPVKTYRTDLHKNCNQIIGKHPKPMDYKEYFKDMPDGSVAQYEKIRKKKKTDE